jgi:hypothetical protein
MLVSFGAVSPKKMRPVRLVYKIPHVGDHPQCSIEIQMVDDRYRTIVYYWDDDSRSGIVEWHPSLRQAKQYCRTLIDLYKK